MPPLLGGPFFWSSVKKRERGFFRLMDFAAVAGATAGAFHSVGLPHSTSSGGNFPGLNKP
jgi:hypothetical protein